MKIKHASAVLLVVIVSVATSCTAPAAAPGSGTILPPTSSVSTAGLPIDESIVPVSRSKPSSEAQAALNACGASGPKGIGVTNEFEIAGIGIVAHAREVPEYVHLWGQEPEIQTDDPAWVVQMVGRVDLGSGKWADDPVCLVVGGKPTVFAPGNSGTATSTMVPPTPPRSPTRALPPLAP